MGGSTETRLPYFLLAGAGLNMYYIHELYTMTEIDSVILLTSYIFLAVNAFRCVFPNRYNANVVLHDHWLSSIFLTRTLATFSEIAWIYQLSYLIQDDNSTIQKSSFVDLLSWLMVIFVIIAQCCVWSSLLLQTERLMLFEESCWAVIMLLNTIGNGINHYYASDDSITYGLRTISLVFAIFYFPWQLGFHLPYINAKDPPTNKPLQFSFQRIKLGARRALFFRNKSTKAEAWGGPVGLIWMSAYWVGLSFWVMYVARHYETILR